MELVTEAARIVLSIFFIYHGVNHFLNLKSLTEYAESKSVPFPKVAVLVGGAALLVGGLTHMFLFNVMFGAVIVSVFLVLAAVMAHRFWTERDAEQRANEMSHFLKNFAVAAATIISAACLA